MSEGAFADKPSAYIRKFLDLWWIAVMVALEAYVQADVEDKAVPIRLITGLLWSAFGMAAADYWWFVRKGRGRMITPLTGIIIGALILLGSVAWWYFDSRRPKPIIEAEKPVLLRRLVAVSRSELALQQTPEGTKFHGFNFQADNVSTDAIEARIVLIRATLNGEDIVVCREGPKRIVEQTRGFFQTCTRTSSDIPIPFGTQMIVVEVELEYDSIPATGMRHSFRKIGFRLNWVNGEKSAPLIEPDIIEEWEK